MNHYSRVFSCLSLSVFNGLLVDPSVFIALFDFINYIHKSSVKLKGMQCNATLKQKSKELLESCSLYKVVKMFDLFVLFLSSSLSLSLLFYCYFLVSLLPGFLSCFDLHIFFRFGWQ